MNKQSGILVINTALIILIIFFLFSCKNTALFRGEKHKQLQAETIINTADSNYFSYSIFSLKFKTEYSDKEGNENVRTYVRLYNDSLIWISVRSMSFEGMRLFLTRDSIKFFDRLNKKYFKGDYQNISELFLIDLDFQLLQNIIKQKFSPFDHNNDKISSCNDSIYQCLNIAARKPKDIKGMINSFHPGWVNQKALFYPEKIFLKENELSSTLSGESFIISYRNKISKDTVNYPDQIEIDFSGKEQIKISMETQKASFNDSVKTPFKIPENYEKVNF